MATAAVVAVLAVAVGLWYARTAILLAFAGLLLAIVLYGGSRALAELTRLPRLAALAIVVLAAVTFFVLVLWGAGPTLGQQVAQLAHSLAAGATSLTKQLASFADQNNLFENIDLVQLLGKFLSPWGIATSATSVALSIVGVFSAGSSCSSSASILPSILRPMSRSRHGWPPRTGGSPPCRCCIRPATCFAAGWSVKASPWR